MKKGRKLIAVGTQIKRCTQFIQYSFALKDLETPSINAILRKTYSNSFHRQLVNSSSWLIVPRAFTTTQVTVGKWTFVCSRGNYSWRVLLSFEKIRKENSIFSYDIVKLNNNKKEIQNDVWYLTKQIGLTNSNILYRLKIEKAGFSKLLIESITIAIYIW